MRNFSTGEYFVEIDNIYLLNLVQQIERKIN